MTSSPIPAARSQYLLDLLSQVPDPRKRRGRRHPLDGLLAVGIAAVTAGSRSFAAIGQWAADAGADVLAGLGAARGPAGESTFRRAFALVGPDMLDQVLGAWLHTRAVQAGGRLVIAVDGKAVRGAKGKDGKAPHLVAALAHGVGAVLGQVAVDAKSNEIPAVRELLKAFADLAGAVITIDALHTQSDTAQVIAGRDADYVMTVKGNMPTLYRQLKKLPWSRIPSASSVSADHGRRARRTIKAALAPAWIEFAGAAQVAQVRRTVTKKGKKTVEVVYLITSDSRADPATLAAWIRGHWEIENKLHWVRDVTYQEDKSLVRTGNASIRGTYAPRRLSMSSSAGSSCGRWRRDQFGHVVREQFFAHGVVQRRPQCAARGLDHSAAGVILAALCAAARTVGLQALVQVGRPPGVVPGGACLSGGSRCSRYTVPPPAGWPTARPPTTCARESEKASSARGRGCGPSATLRPSTGLPRRQCRTRCGNCVPPTSW
jgi:predicted transposase YbfD/YdcC